MTEDSQTRAKADVLEYLKRVVKAPVALSATAATSNLCDIYASFRDRDLFIEVMRDRFPHATATLESLPDWASKLATDRFRKRYVPGRACAGSHNNWAM
jgi:hypothetical protein